MKQLRNLETHPNDYARLAGAIYLLVILFGGYSEGVVMNALVIPGDPAATAHNITAQAGLWRLSLAGNMLVPLIAIPQLWAEYLLLKPAGRQLSLLFVLLNVVSLSVECVSKLFLLMVVPILSRPAGAFSPDQLHALANLALVAHDIAFHITLLFFGATCLASGVLVFRSGYLPRAIGVLMQLAGASYLIASFSQMFAPALAAAITPAILLPALVGESSLCLWLLIKGVNLPKWRERLAQPG